MKNSRKVWLIHLKGQNSLQHVPFGVIKSWLGVEIKTAVEDPREKRLARIAAFRDSILSLLNSHAVLLVVDDAHLFDSASLETLRAILPLVHTHPLIILMSARPEGEDHWQQLFRAAQRAISERTLMVTLPATLAKVRDDLPTELAARRVLECAAVLGKRFSIVVLRHMANVLDLNQHLNEFQTTQYLIPTDEAHIWRFVQTAERDAIYENLAPEYRTLLHWYALQALQIYGLPTEDHAHFAGVAEIAQAVALEAAEYARQFDAPREALIHYDRALSHTTDAELSIDLVLARVEALLSVGNWQAAQETLQFLRDKPDLTPRERARVLIYKGELHRRMGDVTVLFKLYEEAAAILRNEPQTENLQFEQINLLHAQALARFQRGELEIARSIVGGALLQAQRADLLNETPRLWELLASIHRVRNEIPFALRAIERALLIRRAAGERWLLVEALEMLGNLRASQGNPIQSQPWLKEALDLTVQIGDWGATIRLHHRLGQLAGYRGNFDEMIHQLEAALTIARFHNHDLTTITSHTMLAEALALKGDLVTAFYHAHIAVQLAAPHEDDHAGIAQLALAKVAVAAKWWDAAQAALEKASRLPNTIHHLMLRLQIHLTQMEIALARQDKPRFVEALRIARDITPVLGDQLLRGRIALLVSQYKGAQQEWNTAVHEAERASYLFAGIGATYWRSQAEAMLNQFAVQAPDYVRRGQVNGSKVRGDESSEGLPKNSSANG